jgi:hypothetical protein
VARLLKTFNVAIAVTVVAFFVVHEYVQKNVDSLGDRQSVAVLGPFASRLAAQTEAESRREQQGASMTEWRYRIVEATNRDEALLTLADATHSIQVQTGISIPLYTIPPEVAVPVEIETLLSRLDNPRTLSLGEIMQLQKWLEVNGKRYDRSTSQDNP